MSVRRFCALFKRAYVIMGLAFVVSDIGSRLIESAVPALIVLGILPMVFRPVIYTLEDLTDAFAFLASTLTHRLSPVSMMLWCDLYDLTLTAVAIGVLFFFPGQLDAVLITYMVLICPIPVFIDIADERYAGELSTINKDDAARFNTFFYSALAFTGSVIASPIGNLLAGVSVMSLLGANVVLTLAAILCRQWVVQREKRSVTSAVPSSTMNDGTSHTSSEADAIERYSGGNETAEQDEDDELPDSFFSRLTAIKRYHRIVMSLKIGSPAFYPCVSFAIQLSSGYLFLWSVLNYSGHKTRLMATIMLIVGLAGTVAPHISYQLRKYWSNHAQVHVNLLAIIAANVVIFIAILMDGGAISFPFMVLLLAVYCLSVIAQTCVALAHVAERQNRFATLSYYGDLVGLSHSLSGLAALLATWLGYVFLGYRHPIPVLLIGTLLLIILLGCSFARRPR
ncbi:hypothetical protein LMG33818_002291 [Halomonadaceae bacterium LMG 33818]|uniref:MFS transporter n=1 Tax=Cernens ardua TaxID=3402176 RepID=UPI003EDC11FC